MTSRRSSSNARALLFFAGVAGLVIVGATVWIGPAQAQTTRSVSVTPNDQLTHGQFVDVSWTGFQPNEFVRVRLCPVAATAASDCARTSPSEREPGDPKVVRSGAAGSGSSPFVVSANDVVPASGADAFFCDAEHTCRIVVIQLEGSGAERPFPESASVDLRYGLSTIPCPDGGDRIAGSGGSSVRGAMREWQSEVCRDESKLNVSYTTTNSVQGMGALAEGLPDSDYALSGIPLSAGQRSALEQRGIRPTYAPIAAGSLVFVYNVWYDMNGDGKKEQVRDLRLSPTTLAKIMQGRLASWNRAEIAADNPQHQFPIKRVVPVGRADNSAATWWMTSWFWETAREEWKAGGTEFQGGPTTIFPAGNAVVLRTGTDAVADYVRNFPGEQTDENADVPLDGFIGYVYLSEAQKLGLPVVAVRNTAGNYVGPTTENVTAGFAAGDVSSEGVFTPNYGSTDPIAYPIPIASYLIAAAGDSTGVNAQIASTIGRFVMYASGPGQQAAISRGYVPLPDRMKTASESAATKIAQVPVQELQPTQAAVAAAPVPASTPNIITPPTFVSADPQPAPTTPTTTPSVTQRLTDAVPAAAQAILESPPVQAIKKAIAGVLGLSDVGFVPMGMPTMLFGGLVLMIAARLVHMSRRGGNCQLGLRSFFVGRADDPDPAPPTKLGDITSFFGPNRED